MKEKKNNMVGVKLNDTQLSFLDQMVKSGRCSTRSSALQLLINEKIILKN